MSYQLVIAEKPSVARSIAGVIGADKKQDGYMEGNGYLVSWCIGHLVSLADAGTNVTTRTKDRTKLVSYIECDTNKSPRQHEVTLGIVVIWRLFTDSEKSSPRKARESPS